MPADDHRLKRSVSWFACIGALAATVHYVVAVAVEGLAQVLPAYANILGFICAFPVSYLGHRTMSFPDSQASHGHAFPRFLTIALIGFFANQALVLLGLHYTDWPFWIILAGVMVLVAISTYLCSRYWAFA